jgi:hypothetical protein
MQNCTKNKRDMCLLFAPYRDILVGQLFALRIRSNAK